MKKIISLALVVVMLFAATVCSASALIGDINGDNNANSKDYLMLKRYVLGTFDLNDNQLANADINSDGKVNSKDYLMLKRIALGTFTLEIDPAITTIKAAIDSKGELTNTFNTTYLGKEGVATVSFEVKKGVLTLCGHLDITSLGAIVDIAIPFASVSENYKFSGTANQVNFAFDINGNLVAKDYSMEDLTIDVKFTQTAGEEIKNMELTLIPLCKTAMDEFLKEANKLLVVNNVGVTIADLGFEKYYSELPAVSAN